jgi:hypothetical protein
VLKLHPVTPDVWLAFARSDIAEAGTFSGDP